MLAITDHTVYKPSYGRVALSLWLLFNNFQYDHLTPTKSYRAAKSKNSPYISYGEAI